MAAPGEREREQLRGAGFSDPELSEWEARTRRELSEAGFGNREVDEYFGIKQPDPAAVRGIVEQNLAAPADVEAPAVAVTPPPLVPVPVAATPQQRAVLETFPGQLPFTPPPKPPAKPAADFTGQKPPMTFLEAFEAGLGMSVSGLFAGGLPDEVLPEDASAAASIAYMAGMTIGDIPPMIVGGILGAAGGTAVAGPGIGSAVGMGAGSMALPEALRTTYIEQAKKGEVQSAKDFLNRTLAVLWVTLKGGILGGGTVGAGRAAGAATAAFRPAIQTTAELSAEAAAVAVLSRGLEGQLPQPKDFSDAAVLVFGMRGAAAGASKLMDIYAKTGVRPEQIVEHARNEPTVMQDLLSNKEVPTAYEPLLGKPVEAAARPEPVAAPAALAEASSVLRSDTKVEPVLGRPVEPGPRVEAPDAPPRTVAEEAVLERIVPAKERGIELSWDRFYTAAKDDLHPLKQLEKALNGEKISAVFDSPYDLARLTRGSFGRADHFIEFSPFRFADYQNTGKSLKAVLEPVSKDLKGFEAYAVAARALELESRGINSGVPIEAAREVVAAGQKQYGKPLQELQDYQNSLVTYLKDAGILSQDAFEAMLEANKSYIPFYRMVDDAALRTAGRGLTVRNPVKAIKGSDAPIVDPIESIIKNTYLYIELAERNRVAQRLVELAESSPQGAQLVQKVPVPRKPIEVTEPEVRKFLEQHGLDGDQADAFTIFRPAGKGLTDTQIAVYRDGKREVYEVPPEVASAIKAMDRESSGLFVQMLSVPAKMLRAGSVLSPEFMARNLVRDQSSAFVLSKNNFIPVVDLLSGLGSIIKRDENYQNWLKGGGANSTMVAVDRAYIEQNIFKLSKDTGLIDKTWNVVKSPLEALRVVSELLENSTRIGEFKKATRDNQSIQQLVQGGLASREVTLDFSRHGAKTRAMNLITAFWNAHVEGLDRTARAFLERPGPTLTKAVASITLPSVMLWWANQSDPRWKEIPRWQKDMFWIVMTEDTIYRIPKPFELGLVFGSIPERALEAYFAENPDAFKDFEATMTQTFVPEYLPTFATPIIEQFANRSTFTDSPIVPSHLEGLLPEYQFTPYTSETAKLIGHAIAAMPGMKQSEAASPAIIQNYIRSWTGGMGQYALQVLDQSLYASGVVPEPVKPADTLADIPIIKAFVVRYPTSNTQSIQDFYDRHYEKKRVYDTIRAKAKEGDMAAALREAELDPTAFARLDATREALTNTNKAIQMIWRDPSMSPDEKRQLIDTLYYYMIGAAREGNKQLDEVDRMLK